MVLKSVYSDSVINFTHFKYQQTYKGFDVEGAGCLEHFDSSGNLRLINAKVADRIQCDGVPRISRTEALNILLREIDKDNKLLYAWDDPEMERDLQEIEDNIDATYYPSPELFYAIDSLTQMNLIIQGSRYTLAYRIIITTLNPLDIKEYHVSAIDGSIIKQYNVLSNNGPANVFGYGIQTIDTQWKGGFTNAWVLATNDNTRNVHTKRCTGNNCDTWIGTSEVTSSDNNWVGSNLVHTSTHYNMSTAWDYFRTQFNRMGMDNEGGKVRVKSQHQESDFNASYNPQNDMITFFKFPGSDNTLGMDPTIVSHEFMHGITHHTADLIYSGESGALNESFSDIFGVMCHAFMYDGLTTNWIIGDFLSESPLIRNLSDPNSSAAPQPDTYLGGFWSNDLNAVHTNSGVGNFWFFLLSNGGWGVNDLFEFYQVFGIGMEKASIIAYYSLTLLMQNSSQYSDAREATISFASALYGECSLEHQATINAWNAVGVGGPHNCTFTLNLVDSDNLEILLSPNPTQSIVSIQLPQKTSSIKMFDVSGKELSSHSTSELNTSIDVNLLSSGVYFLVFDFDGQLITKRFIKE